MFKNVVFDFDSTLTSLEGLDEIAKAKGVADQISEITTRGMNGELSFDESLRMRLKILNPTKSDFVWLAQEYGNNLVPGAKDLIDELIRVNVNVFLVTGGPRPAIEPVIKLLGINAENVWAVCFSINKTTKATIKADCVMTTASGKIDIVKKIAKTGKTAVIGDGMTDFRAGQHADLFIGFGGVVKRQTVKVKSKIYVEDQNLMNLLKYLKP